MSTRKDRLHRVPNLLQLGYILDDRSLPLPQVTRSWYIAIEGTIGVGKTTLARLLSERFKTGLLLEVFEENPFLAKFYTDRARYAFQTQMFFLLSRFRQQRHSIPQMLEHRSLISDYMFDKDKLFAHLNLAGDEWEMYQRIQAALSEQIVVPDLVVFLQADTDVLMSRIVQRDRPYERDMDPKYIDSVRKAYVDFFSTYEACPVLVIDTNQLSYHNTPADLDRVMDRIRAMLKEGTFQRHLPQLEPVKEGEARLAPGSALAEHQRFHEELDKEKHFKTDLFFNYLCLSEEIGELGSELAKLWLSENEGIANGIPDWQAREKAIIDHRPGLESELADCMAYLLKLANYTGIDLETAYLNKMQVNKNRFWRDASN